MECPIPFIPKRIYEDPLPGRQCQSAVETNTSNSINQCKDVKYKYVCLFIIILLLSCLFLNFNK